MCNRCHAGELLDEVQKRAFTRQEFVRRAVHFGNQIALLHHVTIFLVERHLHIRLEFLEHEFNHREAGKHTVFFRNQASMLLPYADAGFKADIYMQRSAGDDYYADDGTDAVGGRFRYIGIDKRICDLPQVRKLDGDFVIEEGIELFTVKERTHPLPFTNKRLLMKAGEELVRDEFKHEHFLVLTEGEKSLLMGGCAHNGILSIMDAYCEKYGKAPDTVISGFHLMKKTTYRDDQVKEIEDIARELNEYPTIFYTCHCTGLEAFDIMKAVMGDKLIYVHSGDEIIL